MKKTIIKISCVLLPILCIGIICFGGYKFYKHEDKQNQRMSNLEDQVAVLRNEIKSSNDSGEFIQACRQNGGINYLAIGNSITIHPIVEYWWSECVMAADSK